MRLFSLSTLLHAWIIACVVAFPRFPLFHAVAPRNISPTADRTRLLLLSDIPPDKVGDECFYGYHCYISLYSTVSILRPLSAASFRCNCSVSIV